MTSAGGEAPPERENGGEDASWANTNLTGLKMKKIHAVNLVGINGRWRFKVAMSYFFKTYTSEI
jgi:hypothetical protein